MLITIISGVHLQFFHMPPIRAKLNRDRLSMPKNELVFLTRSVTLIFTDLIQIENTLINKPLD